MKITFDNKLDAAVNFAKEKHAHQIRKDEKTLYWVHLAKVEENLRAIGIQDEDILCAGWLHDTIEDTATDYDDLEERFGQSVAELVASVTKDKTLPEKRREQKYVEQISSTGWETHAIKLCDIWANIADVESGYPDNDKRIEQIRKKLVYFNAIKAGLVRNSASMPHLDKAINDINSILSRYNGIKPISLT